MASKTLKRSAVRRASTRADPPPIAEAPPLKLPGGKLGALIDLMRRPDGATIAEMIALTGWQEHSVRGALAGTLKKKFGLPVTSEKADGARVYRIAEPAQ